MIKPKITATKSHHYTHAAGWHRKQNCERLVANISCLNNSISQKDGLGSSSASRCRKYVGISKISCFE